MKNQKITSLIFILIFLNMMISTSESKAVTYSGNVILNFENYIYVNERMLTEDEINWKYAIRGRGRIFVFAADQENFALYHYGDRMKSYYELSVSSLAMCSGIFIIPYSDNWHIVFVCLATYTNVTYEVTFDKLNLALILQITGGIAGIGIIFGVIIGVILLAKKKKKI